MTVSELEDPISKPFFLAFLESFGMILLKFLHS